MQSKFTGEGLFYDGSHISIKGPGSTGAADDQPAAGYVGERLLLIRPFFLKDSDHSAGSQRFDWNADGGQWGLYPLRRWNITKAADGAVIGNAEPRSM